MLSGKRTNVGENRAKMLIDFGSERVLTEKSCFKWNMTVWLHSREERVTSCPVV